MTDFLTFLNTADLDTLTEIPGISRPLAGNIIAARPFDFVEDAIHVKGLGKNLLGRMQSYFEENLNENRAMIAVEQVAAPLEKPQPRMDAPAPEQPSFLSRVWRGISNFMIWLLKLVLTLVLIAGIVAGVYFYVIPAFRQSVVAPVEQNTAQIAELSSQLAAIDEDLASMQGEIDAMNQRVEVLEQTIETQTETLSQLEQMQEKIEQEIQSGNEAVLLELKREVMLTRTLEYLSRGRLYLAQSNFGLAREDVQAAHDLVAQLKEDSPEYQMTALDEVLTRLDLALRNLPEFPVIAINDVNIAWQILMNGLPQSEAEAALIPTATPTAAATATPTLEPTTAPTATP
ncbi:MAG: helix-hairpin-helix domain-containing protein [Chloroflexota bacterium]